MPFIDVTESNTDFDKFKQYYNFDSDIRECFDYISKKSKPYLVTLKDCIDVGYYGPNSERYGTHKLLEHVTHLIRGINGNAITSDTWKEEVTNDHQNMVYHCCKIMYLIDQYKEVGLHSTLQAISEGNHMFVHPGCSRIHAHSYLKAYDEKIIVWDRHNKFSECNSGWPRTPLSYDEWYNIFANKNKTIFATNVEGQILEMHMQEDRKDIVGSVQNVRAMFNFEKPILLGQCEDDVYEYIRTNTDESKGVVIDNLAGDYVFKKEDLIHILGLYPYSSEKVVTENFVIYTKD